MKTQSDIYQPQIQQLCHSFILNCFQNNVHKSQPPGGDGQGGCAGEELAQQRQDAGGDHDDDGDDGDDGDRDDRDDCADGDGGHQDADE